MKKEIRKVLLAVCSALFAGCLFVGCASNEVKVSYMVDGEVYREQSYELNADMALPKDPTKDGHVFVGWYTDEALTQPYAEGKITYGMTLYAKFNKSTLYISVNVNGGEKINPIAVTPGEAYVVPDAVKTGYTFTGYTYIDGETGEEKEFPSSGTFPGNASIRINANYTINKYTVTLKDGFSNASETAEVEYGKTYSPRPPVRTGYTFVDWYTSDETQTDATKFDKTQPITDNVTLWAAYTPNAYTVTITLDGGALDAGVSNAVGVTYASSYELPTPTKTGYTFTGYTLDGASFDKTGVYAHASSIVVKANWTINKYSVTFKNMDDSENTTLTDIVHGNKVSAPAASVGYQLKAVYASDKQTPVDLATATITAETTYYVEYEAKTFTIIVNGAQDGYQNPTVKYGENYTLVAPDRGEGYEFKGFKDKDGNDFALTGAYTWAKDITVTAQWDSVYHNVYFYDGNTELSALRIEKQGGTDISTITLPAAPVKTGYTADTVWYSDKEFTAAFDATGEMTEDIKLYAKYTANTYEIAITLGEGVYEGQTATNDVVTVEVTYGQAIGLKQPTKKGYTFAGYTMNGVEFTADVYSFAHDITLIANWNEDRKSVQFYGENGLWSETSVLNGFTVSAPAVPEKTGYTFKGWSTSQTAPSENNLFDFNSEITTDIDLYAWFTVNTYTIYVYERDKTTATEYTVEYGKVPAISEPTHDNYTFVGWFTEKDGKGNKVDLLTYYEVASNTTVYEFWTVKDNGSDPNFRDNGDNFQERADENAAWTYVYLVGHTYNFSGTTFTVVENDYAIVSNENGKGKLVALAPGEFTLDYVQGGKTGTMKIKIVEKVYTFNAGADYSNAWIHRDASVWDNDEKNSTMTVGRTNFIPDVVITKNAAGDTLSLSEANVQITVKAGDTLVTDYTTDGNAITFGSTVADGTTLTVTLAPRYAIFSGQTLSFTFVVNSGVNVYDSEQLRLAYEDSNVSTINVLRNINAVLIAERTNTTGVGFKTNGNDSYTVTEEFTSPINPDGGAGVYDRVSGNLAINGNYFTVNGGNIPLVDNRDGDRGFNVCQNGNVLHNVQFALFKFGKDDSDISDKLTMENLNIIGNFNKATNTESDYTINDKKALIMSGSFIGVSVRSGNLYMDNVTARRCLFGVAIYGVNPKKTTNNETNSLHASSVYAKDCIFENSWANNVYTWGFGKVTLDSSFVGASSGAAIHFDSLASATPVNCALDMLNGTKVENWVLGTETWFDVYNVSAIVPTLKTEVEGVVSQYSGAKRTIIKNGTDNPTDQYVNFILLMKSPGDNSEWVTDDIGHGSVDVNMAMFDLVKAQTDPANAGSPINDYVKFAKDMTALGFGYMEGIVGIINAG